MSQIEIENVQGYSMHDVCETQMSTCTVFALKPSLRIKLDFTDSAKKVITTRNNSIAVAGWIYGQPKPGANPLYVREDGKGVLVGDFWIDSPQSSILLFDQVSMPQHHLQQVAEGDYDLRVEVFSNVNFGKKSLLKCGNYQGSLKEAQLHGVSIVCAAADEKDHFW